MGSVAKWLAKEKEPRRVLKVSNKFEEYIPRFQKVLMNKICRDTSLLDMKDIELSFNLHNAQLDIFNTNKRFKIVAAGRRFGKSYLSAITLLIEGLKNENKYGYKLDETKAVYYVAPTFQQAKDIMWKLLKKLGAPVIAATLENTNVIKLINGREIHLKGSDRPETLLGVGLSYVVMDEYASMKPQVWEEILSPTLADVKGGALFIGSPRGKNHFYKLYQEAVTEMETRPNDTEWAAFTFKSVDNPFLSADEIKSQKRRLSKAAFKQEFEASFSTAGGNLLSPELIVVSDTEPEEGNYYITVDPAGFGTKEGISASKFAALDETAISIVKVGQYGWWVHSIVHGRWDARETSIRILRAAQTFRPRVVGIEKGALKNAIMPYLSDQCARLNTWPNIQDVSHGGKSKIDRIVWSLQGRLEHGRVQFKSGEYLEKLEEQMGDFPNPMAHDDLLDSLAYIDQVAIVSYFDDFVVDNPYAKPLDSLTGY